MSSIAMNRIFGLESEVDALHDSSKSLALDSVNESKRFTGLSSAITYWPPARHTIATIEKRGNRSVFILFFRFIGATQPHIGGCRIIVLITFGSTTSAQADAPLRGAPFFKMNVYSFLLLATRHTF
jgi:hypothetical protein